MFRLKKGEFNLIFAEQQGGAVINIFRDNSKISQAFGVVDPGNLFILSNGQWVLLDIAKIMAPTQQFKNDLERASAAFTIKLMQTSIDSKYIVLNAQEQIFIFAVVYDIASRTPIEWIVKADAYFLSDGKLEAVTGNQVTNYILTGIPRQLNKADIYPTVIITPSPQKGVKPSPVKLDLVQIQKTKNPDPGNPITTTVTNKVTKTMSPLKLPPVSQINNIPPGLVVNKDKAEKKRKIMELALKRAQRKAQENPNQEPPILLGDWKTTHKKYLKELEEQKFKETLKRARLAQERKEQREMLRKQQEEEAKKKEQANKNKWYLESFRKLRPEDDDDDSDSDTTEEMEDTEEIDKNRKGKEEEIYIDDEDTEEL
jgi:hypothetical protein